MCELNTYQKQTKFSISENSSKTGFTVLYMSSFSPTLDQAFSKETIISKTILLLL